MFFFNDPYNSEIYTLSLHDALPISLYGWAYNIWRWLIAMPSHPLEAVCSERSPCRMSFRQEQSPVWCPAKDRKSTRLNSSHRCISYAVFCLKKKKQTYTN